jgi:hypothetical protein
MAQSNDVLAQLLLQQSRQQGRRQSASSRLAEQMMAGLNNPTPVYSTGATLARAGSGLLAGLLAQQAESRDQAREDEQMQRLQDRTDKRDYLGNQAFSAAMTGRAPQAPQPQQQPIQTAPEGTVQREPLAPLPPAQARGEAPLAVSQGIAQRAALDPNAPDYAESIARINNGVIGQTMPGQAPQPAPRQTIAPAAVTQGQPGGDLLGQIQRMQQLVGSGGPGSQAASRVLPGLQWQYEQSQRQPGELREMNGSQGPGIYRVGPNGPPTFVGGRMPPQEGAETFTGAPQTVMQNGQPVLVQMGNRGTVRPMQGYGPRNEGQFGGTSMDAQALNILLAPNADPSSPTYAAAFNQAYGPRTVTQADGTVVTIQPQPPAGIRAPVVNSQPQAVAQPQAAAPALQQPVQPQASAGAVAPEVTQTPGATVTTVRGTTGTLTESQSRSNMFGNAMSEGHRILQEIQIPGNATLVAWRNAPETLVNMALSQNDQQYFNALRQFAAGVLRKETGAAFSNSELMDVQSRFFPMPGDSLINRQQKARARQQAIESMRAEIPGGFRGQLPPEQAGQPAPSPGARVIQYGADGQRISQ